MKMESDFFEEIKSDYELLKENLDAGYKAFSIDVNAISKAFLEAKYELNQHLTLIGFLNAIVKVKGGVCIYSKKYCCFDFFPTDWKGYSVFSEELKHGKYEDINTDNMREFIRQLEKRCEANDE